ncbi:YjgN family protein [Photobacterium sp. R1]
MNNKVVFHGKGGEFFGIWIVNILLSIVTLGIYSAWAKVRTKKYFHGNLELDGDRFDYHATPKQILIGRLIASVCVLVWAVASNFMPVIASLLMLVFVGFSPLLARNNARFDARMTSYRNVRFNFNGSLKGAYWAMLGCGLFSSIPLVILLIAAGAVRDTSIVASVLFIILSFAAYIFIFANVTASITRYFANGYQYGDRQFSAEISTGFFVKTVLFAALLGIGIFIAVFGVIAIVAGMGAMVSVSSGQMDSGFGQILGAVGGMGGMAGMVLLMVLVSAFIQVRARNYTFAQMKVEGEPEYGFSSTLTTGGFLSLTVTNFLAQVFSLGLARPWVMVRTSHYFADHTLVIGDLSQLKAKGELTDDGAAIADEVAAAFDIELGLG